MKSVTVSAISSIALLSSSTLAAITMNIARTPAGSSKFSRRNLSPRATITESLVNNVTGGSYMVSVSVGTPGQMQSLAIDTGSSDVWVLDVGADACTDPTIQAQEEDGCVSTYDPSKSSSYKVVDQNGFFIQYADGSGAEGDYITENLQIGGATVNSLEMGLAYNVTLFTGLLGIGYDTDEASENPDNEENPFIYPSIIDTMVSQGLISTKAYSLYLDDLQASTGSIIFGGLDTDKYEGDLLQVPIVPETLQNGSSIYTDFAVALTSFAVTGQAGNTTTLTQGNYNEPVILDSGTTLTYIPQRLAELLYQQLNAIDDSQNSGYVFVDCNILTNSPKMTFDFGFGGSNGIAIKVPVDELIFPLEVTSSGDGASGPVLPFQNTCALGLGGQDEEPYILGDTFLRSAYVVYDLKNNVIALAQTNFNSTTSNIVDFTADATSIPNVSGVASSAAVTETATGILPIGSSRSTTTGASTATPVLVTTSVTTATTGSNGESTGSSATRAGQTTTSSPTSSSSSPTPSNAAGSLKAFDSTLLAVLALSSMLALLGGGWFLA